MNPILYTISTLPFFKRAYSRSAQESKSSVVLKNGRSKSVIQRKNYRAKHHYFFKNKCNANAHTNNNSISLADGNNNANNINTPNHQSIRNQISLNGSFCQRNNSINQRKNTYTLRRQQSSVSSSSSLALTPMAQLTPRTSSKSSKSIYFDPNQCN